MIAVNHVSTEIFQLKFHASGYCLIKHCCVIVSSLIRYVTLHCTFPYKV